MKKSGLIGLCIILSLGFFFSCLGDDGQKLSVSNQPGVVMKTADSTKIQLRAATVYSDKISGNVENNDCVIVKYSIDYGLADTDASENNIYKVDVENIQVLAPDTLKPQLKDTTEVISKNEQILSAIQLRHAIIRNKFFLYTEHTEDVDFPVNEFNLSYNTDYVPTPDANGKKVYELFLRSIKKEAGGSSVKPEKVHINAFDISDLMAKKGADTLFFKVNYVRGFNRDTTAITYWGSANFSYPSVVKENSSK